jgi:hypothetical protein
LADGKALDKKHWSFGEYRGVPNTLHNFKVQPSPKTQTYSSMHDNAGQLLDHESQHLRNEKMSSGRHFSGQRDDSSSLLSRMFSPCRSPSFPYA